MKNPPTTVTSLTVTLSGCVALILAPASLLASQPLPFNQSAIKQSTDQALLGPNPANPYFHVRFALPIPPENDLLRSGSSVGIDAAVADHHNSPAFEIMPNGDALMISYSGPSGREGGPETLMAQTRLRYGAEEFDMPEHVSVGGKSLIELLKADGQRVTGAPPLLWREGSTVWMFMGGHHFQGMPQPPDDSRPGGFRVFKSTDSGATWEIVALEPTFSALSADSQPITNAFRAPNGDMFVACDGKSGDGTSMLWRSSNNGLSWTDQGGRTSGRHSTIVPLNDSGRLLSFGGKDTNLDNNGVVFEDEAKNRYMPYNTSDDWGKTWSAAKQSPFPWLGANQRPSMTRLANGNLVMVGDSRYIHNPDITPSGWTHGDGPYVALSTDDGSSWTIKALPVALRHDWARHKTIGYSTVRQAPNGVIHILAVNCHPSLHYELNEAWITTPSAGDIAPETTGGTVQSYSETHPGGAPKATWSARRTAGGRYLLNGLETHFYPDGKKQREVTWVNGSRTGPETYWGPDGTRIWSWNHDLANKVSTWTHWWSNGQKRLESQWNTNPFARDLPARNFRGLVAHGTARHWNPSGQQTGQFAFLDGNRIFPLGNHSERFATDPGGRGWTGSNNTTNGNSFGWSSTTSHANDGNKPFMKDKGEIGGVFARSSTYRWFADTSVGTRNRTQTLRFSGVMNLAAKVKDKDTQIVTYTNFDGTFRIGYFSTSAPAGNFIGLEIRELAGKIVDPMLYGSGKRYRAYLTVYGKGGATSSQPLELDEGDRKAFDLIWTPNSNGDGSGTLSGSVQSIPLPAITVGAGTSNFNAFGLLNGGAGSNNTEQRTFGCWFDNLVYDKGTVTTHTLTYFANGATSGSEPSSQTKPSGVNIPVSANSGNLAKAGFKFAGWKSTAGTNYAPGALYTANADTKLSAQWTAATTFNINYDPNGATGGAAPATQIKTQNEALTLSANSGNLTRTSHVFAGWNTARDGSGTDYSPGQTYAADAPLQLFAKWAVIPRDKKLIIMPMGDSITQGTVPGGYRRPLHTLLKGHGVPFDFVGRKNQSGDTALDTNHWGEGGWQISKTPATIEGRPYVSIQGENRLGIYEEMSEAISTQYFSTNTSSDRNIILLHIGINDILHQVVDDGYGNFDADVGGIIYNGKDIGNGYGEGQQWIAEGMLARMQALLNSINSLARDRDLRIDVILGTLCPLTKTWYERDRNENDPVSDVMLGEVDQYNSYIRNVIPSMTFSNISVKVVDQTTPTIGKLSDGLHPNQEGYDAMAQVWHDAILAPPSSTISAGTPSITSQPASATINSGGTATLSVTAGGTSPLSYQWYQGNSGTTTTPVGTNSASFTTPALTATTSYWVRVSNSAGSVNSNTATVTVNAPVIAPSISSQPASTTINSGGTATLSVTASGTGPLSYQWYRGSSGTTTTPVGTNSASFTTPALTATTSYWVRVSNSAGSLNSNTATITVNAPVIAPSITSQPASATINSGGTATLSVTAGGTGPLSYQWYQGNSGATTTPVGTNSASFTTPALTATTSYWVRVSNSGGSVNSNTATVTVNPASSGILYWDNTDGTANDWGSVTNWSIEIEGGRTPAALPATTDVVAFSATPIQGTAQTVNLKGNRSVMGLSVLSGVTANTTLQAGGTSAALTIGSSGISNAGPAGIVIGSGVQIIFAGSQNIAANGSGGITVSDAISGSNSPTITNNGTGTGSVNLSGAFQSTVSKIVQDSASSKLLLRARATGSLFNGNIDILRGTVMIGTDPNNLGSTSGQLNLGSSAAGATASAELEIIDNQNITYAAKPIVLGTTAGTLKITLNDDFTGSFTHTITGGVTGANNLTIESRAASGTEPNSKNDKLTFSDGALNNAGTITHIGDSGGDLTINAVIGSNVTGVIQDSATSRLVLGGVNTYAGDTIVRTGTLAVNGNAIPDTGKLVVHENGKVDPSGTTEIVHSLFFGGVQQVAGTWGATGSGATNINDTYFIGTGVVRVSSGPLAIGGDLIENIMDNGVNYRVHHFTSVSSHSFQVLASTLDVEYLIVGGGGGSGGLSSSNASGAGGAGGYLSNVGGSPLRLGAGSQQIVVGAGGAGGGTTGGRGAQGANSSAFGLTAIGGGGGGGNLGTQQTGGVGGSGGGHGANSQTVASAGTAGQGNSGGIGYGGGGGAGAAGQAAGSGNGLQNSISGITRWYAGGGAGVFKSGVTPLGGGGSADVSSGGNQATDGLPNTGGGGGAIWHNSAKAGRSGGSGVVIVRYRIPSGAQPLSGQMASMSVIESPSEADTDFTENASAVGAGNDMAFLLGALGPDDKLQDLLPTPAISDDGLVLSFRMRDAATRGDAGLSVEFSSDLTNWTSVPVPDTSGTSAEGLMFQVTGSGIQDISVTIPSSHAANGRLYARLKAGPQ